MKRKGFIEQYPEWDDEEENDYGIILKSPEQWKNSVPMEIEHSAGKNYIIKENNRMRRRFNTAGSCNPNRHYMVKLGGRLKEIILLRGKQPLFESMMKQIKEYPDMKHMLHAILFQGRRVVYNPDTPAVDLAYMFGYVADRNGCVQVANRIFEMRLYNLFLSEAELASAISDRAQQNTGQFICGNQLDMDLVLEKFVEYFTDIYGDNDEKFVEEYGRKFFLLYLKPIINGVGNYYTADRQDLQ